MRFASPLFLLLLFIIPVMFWYYIKHWRKRSSSIKYPSLRIIKKVHTGEDIKMKYLKILLRVFTVLFLILALSRPQKGQRSEEVTSKGIDIILCIDTSGSMKAEDFKPNNRLYAAKQAAKDFVRGRKNDRIGVVVFSAIAFTQCPLTVDYGAVLDFIDKIEIGMTQTDGTAIGNAIVTCVNRLKDSTAKSKVIILLTDGANNTGEIDPLTAAETARAMDIKIYTIGAGVPGGAMVPVDHPIFGKSYIRIPDELDEDTLTKIALNTGGGYFRATSSEGLKSIYRKIDEMEKTEIKVDEYIDYNEIFPYFILPALIFFLSEIILFNTYYRKVP